MLIVNGNGREFFNSEYMVGGFMSRTKDGSYIVSLRMKNTEMAWTIGKYDDEKTAEMALFELLRALIDGADYHIMLGGMGISEIIKDARVKRRGGS